MTFLRLLQPENRSKTHLNLEMGAGSQKVWTWTSPDFGRDKLIESKCFEKVPSKFATLLQDR